MSSGSSLTFPPTGVSPAPAPAPCPRPQPLHRQLHNLTTPLSHLSKPFSAWVLASVPSRLPSPSPARAPILPVSSPRCSCCPPAQNQRQQPGLHLQRASPSSDFLNLLWKKKKKTKLLSGLQLWVGPPALGPDHGKQEDASDSARLQPCLAVIQGERPRATEFPNVTDDDVTILQWGWPPSHRPHPLISL